MLKDIKEIKKLNDVDEIIEEYEEFNREFSCRPDREKYPYPRVGEILNEEKSVKWNREEVIRLREEHDKEVVRLNIEKNNINNTYEESLVKVLSKEAKITRKEANIIWDFAYSQGHSCGIDNCVGFFREITEL